MASASAETGVEAWIEFQLDDQERIEVLPYASASAPQEVRHELVVEAEGASGHAATRQSGQTRIDGTPHKLSTFRLQQGGGGPIKAKLTVTTADGSVVSVTERYEREQ